MRKTLRHSVLPPSLTIRIFSVHPKYGQKRPDASPVPSSMHHHSQPALGGQTTVMPAHMNSQSMQQQQMHHQKSQNNMQASANSRNSEQSFAAALRSLAKQQIDIKDEDMIQQGDNKNSSGNQRVSEKEHEASRQTNSSRSMQYDNNRPTDMRNLTSPQPPEKKVKSCETSARANCAILKFIFPDSSPKQQREPTAVVSEHANRAARPQRLPTVQTRRASPPSSRRAVPDGRFLTVRPHPRTSIK